MNIFNKVRFVQSVLNLADKDVAVYKKAKNIDCVSNCSSCCSKIDIFCSEIEFYPLAYFLYKNHLAYEILNLIDQSGEDETCPLFNKTNIDGSGCKYYKYRGLICRLFGFSFNENKNDQKRILTCKTLKNKYGEDYLNSVQTLKKVPVMSDYYLMLSRVDMYRASKLVPIKFAIKSAIEYILFNYELRGKKVS